MCSRTVYVYLTCDKKSGLLLLADEVVDFLNEDEKERVWCGVPLGFPALALVNIRII